MRKFLVFVYFSFLLIPTEYREDTSTSWLGYKDLKRLSEYFKDSKSSKDAQRCLKNFDTSKDTQSCPGRSSKDIWRHRGNQTFFKDTWRCLEQPREPHILWEIWNYLELPEFLQVQTPFSWCYVHNPGSYPSSSYYYASNDGNFSCHANPKAKAIQPTVWSPADLTIWRRWKDKNMALSSRRMRPSPVFCAVQRWLVL